MPRKFSHVIASSATQFIYEYKSYESIICPTLSVEIVISMLHVKTMNEWFAFWPKETSPYAADKKRCSSFSFLIPCLKSVEGASLDVVTRIYLKEGVNLKPKTKKMIEKVFDLSSEYLHFEEKQESVDIINEWVASQTKNAIRDILSPKDINEQTCMILINAIHFKATWMTPFKIEETKNKDFHVNDTTTVQVPQMFQSKAFVKHGFSNKINIALIGLYYKGTQSCLVIILPEEQNGLDEMVQTLTAGAAIEFMDDLKAMEWSYIDVTLPKFKVEMDLNAKNILKKLELEHAFNKETSSIDMLTSSKQQFVSEAFQKASIEVDEAGVEAAGAACWPVSVEDCERKLSYIRASKRPSAIWKRGYPQPPEFVADRPFLFLLMVHGIPIFAGTYRGPQDVIQGAHNEEQLSRSHVEGPSCT